MMVTNIITIYCICEDFFKEINYKDNKQTEVKTSEILTIALTAMKFFGGNYKKSYLFFKSHNYFKKYLSYSRFIRRLNSIDKDILNLLFAIFARSFKESNKNNEYIIDSFPVPVCCNIRIKRCKIYNEKCYRGYSASKKEFFYGIKVHMLVTEDGKPVEFTITPGSVNDLKAAKTFTFNLLKDSNIYADKGYNDYEFENYLKKERKINLLPQRKSNSKKPNKYKPKIRKRIESVFSSIVAMFPNRIHAVTRNGFELKVILFICLYYSFF